MRVLYQQQEPYLTTTFRQVNNGVQKQEQTRTADHDRPGHRRQDLDHLQTATRPTGLGDAHRGLPRPLATAAVAQPGHLRRRRAGPHPAAVVPLREVHRRPHLRRRLHGPRTLRRGEDGTAQDRRLRERPPLPDIDHGEQTRSSGRRRHGGAETAARRRQPDEPQVARAAVVGENRRGPQGGLQVVAQQQNEQQQAIVGVSAIATVLHQVLTMKRVTEPPCEMIR